MGFFVFKFYFQYWVDKLKDIIPSYGEKLEGNRDLIKMVRNHSSRALELDWEQA